MVIPPGRTVTVSSNITYNAPIEIQVGGTLYFSGGGAKLKMPCGSWVLILPGGTLDGNGNGNSQTITICNITYWSAGFDGRISGPAGFPQNILPVELIDFNVRSIDHQVVCGWSTASEQGSDRFEVWVAQDGALFTKVGTVQGQGTCSIRVDYTWGDPEPRSGLWYYQLRQVDDNDTSTELAIRAVHVEPQQLMAWPNPATSLLHVRTAGPGTTHLIDPGGQVVMTIPATEGQQVLDVSHLRQGAYLLRSQNGDGDALRFAIVR
jgi:hypothetical protein